MKTDKGFKVENNKDLSSIFYMQLAASINTYKDIVKYLKNNEFEILTNDLILENRVSESEMGI